jgi:hypothetical protein
VVEMIFMHLQVKSVVASGLGVDIFREVISNFFFIVPTHALYYTLKH